MERSKQQLTTLYDQQSDARAEVGKPFPQEAELAVKSARLAELDAALNMDDRGEEDREIHSSERPSVLADLKSKSAQITNSHNRKDHEEVL